MPDIIKICNTDYEPGLVSVIVPTYNRSELIVDCLESVYAQIYRPIELIVIDDGSSDDTAAVFKNWCRKRNNGCDLSCHYFFKNNEGGAEARNFGISKSKGEFIQFLDSDDLLNSGKIKKQVDALLNNPQYQAVYCSWRSLFDASVLKYGPVRQRNACLSEDMMLRGYLSGKWFLPLHSFLFSRSSVMCVGPWDSSLYVGQDTDYLIRMLLLDFKFTFVDGEVVLYRRHRGAHVSSYENSHVLMKKVAANVLLREKAYFKLKKRGIEDDYHSEFEEWFKYLIFQYGDEIPKLILNDHTLFNLNHVPKKTDIAIFHKLLRSISKISFIREFRYRIGDYLASWIMELYNNCWLK